MKSEHINKLTIPAQMHCMGIDPFLRVIAWIEATRDSTSLLSGLQRSEQRYLEKSRWVYILHFVSSAANQNGSNTGLAANVTSNQVTDHVILESSVF